MKNLLNFTIYWLFIFIFCTFFICNLNNKSTQTLALTNPKKSNEILPLESELQEYQIFEHSVPTTTENPKEFFEPTDTVPSRNYTVVIDAGHGSPDPGSIGYKTKVLESEINLKLSKLLKEKLEDAGINVVLTRETENGLAEGRGKAFKKRDMEMRKEIIKKTRPNLVLSIHQNSYTNHSLKGAQVFYDKSSEISKQIAESIQNEFIKHLENSNKCTSPGDYYMLKCSSAPSVIVECGFLSNAEEEQLLQTQTYQQKIVDALYFGIVNFLQSK